MCLTGVPLGVGPGVPLEIHRSPSDLKLLFGMKTQIARVPGCLGVDELDLLARLGRVGGSTPGTGMAEARRMRTCH